MRAASALAAALAAVLLLPPGSSAELGLRSPAATRSWVARVVAPVVARAAPGGGPIVARIGTQAAWNDGPMRLLVLDARRTKDDRTWLRVRLPGRPNGSSGWIPGDVTRLSTTPWRIRVSLGRRTVTLLRSGRRVRVSLAVVGARRTPTPTGLFAVSERVRQPDPRAFYGPWVLLLTAYSQTLSHFAGGPGQIGIHGRAGTSLNDPLGTARSHGCIRVPNDAVDLLASVAVEGTPVEIRP